jgi:hypothetical protein
VPPSPPSSRPLPPPPPKPPARTLHRSLSLLGAVALFAFIVSGIALEHAASLGLDRHFAPSAVARWLGARTAPAVEFVAGTHRLAQVGDVLVLDDRVLTERPTRLLGAAAVPDGLVMLTTDALVVIDAAGSVLDRATVPAAASALGHAGDDLVADTAAGVFAFDPSLATWTRRADAPDATAIAWVRAAAVDAVAQQRYDALYYAHAVTWSSALAAMHSGRIFGRYGAVIVDAAALVLLALALSGAWLARQRG